MHISEMQWNIQKKSFVSEIMAFEICSCNFCILLREYLSSAVNVLINSLKISDHTKADIFQLNLSRIQGKKG